MTNQEKDTLRRLVLKQIKAGRGIHEATFRLKLIGYNPSIVRRYYEALSTHV